MTSARLAAVVSRNAERARGFADAHGAGLHADLSDLIANPSVDAVYIATPNHLHVPQALEIIAGGKPVLIEKPVATTSADASRLFGAAEQAGVFAMEAMWSRFLPAVQQARRLIGQGAIGDPVRIEAELAYPHDPATSARLFEANGGGASLDLGVYPLSLAIYLFGLPEQIGGRWKRGPSGVDIAASFDLQMGLVSAQLACSIDRNGANQFTIHGTKGALRLNAPFLKAQRLTLYGAAAKDWPLIGTGRGLPGLAGRVLARAPVPGRQIFEFGFPGNGLQFEIEAFMQSVREGQTASAIASPQDSIAVLRAIEAVLSRPPAG